MNNKRTAPHYVPITSVRLIREGSLPCSTRVIKTPEDAYTVMRDYFAILPYEAFVVLLLNTKNYILQVSEVSRGSLDSAIVAPREIFQRACLGNAKFLILCHNHPSTIPEPSSEDILLTKKLVDAGKIMDIPIIDHIVFGPTEYVSFKERGLI